MDNNINNNLNNDLIQNNMEPTTPNVPLEEPNSMKFDPMTGEPITPVEPVQTVMPVEPVVPITPVNEEIISEATAHTDNIVEQNNDNVNDAIRIQNELQNIPTVEQDKEAFINNIQASNQEKKEEKKEGVNFVFIIILLVVILGSILFLFPFLLDHI